MRNLIVSTLLIVSLFSSVEVNVICVRNGDELSEDLERALLGTITVTGRWYYFFNTTHGLPIANARVEIYDNETTSVTYLGTTQTNYNGDFTFGPTSNDDGSGEGGLDIIITVNATSSAARVINSSGIIYSAQTGTYWNRPDGTFSAGNLWTSYNQRGAWWIFSYHFGLTRGWKYLVDTVGYSTSQVTARWPYETWPHYHPGGEIHLPDWSWGWPDVVNHEYAHHVMYKAYGFLPPTMTEHSITLRSNSTTAWAEGWADFFPLAVFNDPVFTWTNGTHYSNINLETPTWFTSGWDNGDEVEGRVAGALWDIFDSVNDGYETFSDGFSKIWNILSTQSDNTFREFWQAWCLSGYQKQLTLMAIFQSSIDYRGLADINGDGVVDIFDSIILSNAYGSYRGGSGWDQRADLNYDDVVDLYDATILAANFGRTYGC